MQDFYKTDNHSAIFYLQGEIDHHSCKQLREEIDAEVQSRKPRTLILDFSDVSFMDSSGIGLVMGRYKLMSANSGIVRLDNMPEYIKRVMKMSGVEKLLAAQ